MPFCFGTNSPLQMTYHQRISVSMGGYILTASLTYDVYLGAESAVSSENPLKSLRIRADFDSTMRVFKSSDQTASNGYYQRMSVSVRAPDLNVPGLPLDRGTHWRCDKIWNPHRA